MVLVKELIGYYKVVLLIRSLEQNVRLYFKARKNPLLDTVELEKSLASFRKLLRLGTCFDTGYGIRETITHADPVVRWTSTLRRVSLALYLYYDHLVCCLVTQSVTRSH